MRFKKTILGILAGVLLLGAACATRAAESPKGKAAARASARKRHTVRRTRRRRRRVVGQRRPTHERVEQIQTALEKAGTFHGKIDGIWGKVTSQAMKEFQSSQGLPPTGKINAKTLQKLGLGSEVAGMGAPVPPIPPDEQSDQQNP